jgi:hypothetical membrane protein
MINYKTIAGTLLLFGFTEFLIFEHIAEEVYPGYSVSLNAISDLGATCNSSGICTIVQPSSTIFNSSIIVLGLSMIISSFFILRSTKGRVFSVFLFLAGIGATGVGIFPETTGGLHGVTMGDIHTIVSFITFFFAGLSAITSFQLVKSTLRYFVIVMGVIVLIALVLFVSGTYLGLGYGGMERMIALPALFWGLAFASSLIMQGTEKVPTVAT